MDNARSLQPAGDLSATLLEAVTPDSVDVVDRLLEELRRCNIISSKLSSDADVALKKYYGKNREILELGAIKGILASYWDNEDWVAHENKNNQRVLIESLLQQLEESSKRCYKNKLVQFTKLLFNSLVAVLVVVFFVIIVVACLGVSVSPPLSLAAIFTLALLSIAALLIISNIIFFLVRCYLNLEQEHRDDINSSMTDDEMREIPGVIKDFYEKLQQPKFFSDALLSRTLKKASLAYGKQADFLKALQEFRLVVEEAKRQENWQLPLSSKQDKTEYLEDIEGELKHLAELSRAKFEKKAQERRILIAGLMFASVLLIQAMVVWPFLVVATNVVLLAVWEIVVKPLVVLAAITGPYSLDVFIFCFYHAYRWHRLRINVSHPDIEKFFDKLQEDQIISDAALENVLFFVRRDYGVNPTITELRKIKTILAEYWVNAHWNANDQKNNQQQVIDVLLAKLEKSSHAQFKKNMITRLAVGVLLVALTGIVAFGVFPASVIAMLPFSFAFAGLGGVIVSIIDGYLRCYNDHKTGNNDLAVFAYDRTAHPNIMPDVFLALKNSGYFTEELLLQREKTVVLGYGKYESLQALQEVKWILQEMRDNKYFQPQRSDEVGSVQAKATYCNNMMQLLRDLERCFRDKYDEENFQYLLLLGVVILSLAVIYVVASMTLPPLLANMMCIILATVGITMILKPVATACIKWLSSMWRNLHNKEQESSLELPLLQNLNQQAQTLLHPHQDPSLFAPTLRN